MLRNCEPHVSLSDQASRGSAYRLPIMRLPPASSIGPGVAPQCAGAFLLGSASYIRPVPHIVFIPIASPKLRPAPPTGHDWLHEIKFDGFRIQLHKAGDDVRLYSRNGKDFTDRFPSITAAVRGLGAKSAAIDGELVSCDSEGKPDFYALMRRRTSGLCVWCFDLLTLNERDLRSLPFGATQGKAGRAPG